MASKSKKRRRVLGASCILAALIIAGSSFAWFTSSDEVTNRLSANADYDVSIVESFAPPENWLPGQEVNKDVYAVNTGTVDAFVEETVSGILTVTKEVKDDAAGNGEAYADATADVPVTPKADDIKLTPAERYVIEDGSYLALAPKTSSFKAGEKVVAMNPDFDDENGYTAAAGDFGPDAPGLYVFRRSIKVDDATQVETFKYDAYYFDGQNYYKVTNLKTTPADIYEAGDADKNDGNLASATYNLVKDVSETVVPTLKYEAKAADHPNRLVATYDVGTANSDLRTLAKTYDDACFDYVYALEKYQAALDDESNANTAVNNANTALQTALQNYRNALAQLDTLNDTLTEKTNAKTAADNELAAATADLGTKTTAYENAMKALYGNKDGGTTAPATDDTNGEADNYTTGSLYGKYKAAEAAETVASTALGSSSDPAAASGSKWAEYKYAKAAREAAEGTSAKDAFAQWLKDNNYISDVANADTYLASLTYAQMVALNANNNANTYQYYRLCVAEKEAEKAKDDATDELTAKTTAKAEAWQNYNDGVAAKDAANTAKNTAQTRVDSANRALYGYKDGGIANGQQDGKTEGTNSANCYTSGSAYGEYMKAQNDVDDQMRAIYGWKDGGTTSVLDSGTEGTDTAGKYKSGDASLYGKVKAAETTYNTALTTTGTTASNNLKTARANLANATQAKQDAQEAYEAAMANSAANELKININLSDDVTATAPTTANQWQVVTSALFDLYDNTTTAEYAAGATADNLTDTARFYYTGILGAGETTSKLIDSVELDKSVTNDMFKRFDFDLNVGLKSAQIAYDDAGNVTAEAANATLDANATNPDADGKVTWTTK